MIKLYWIFYKSIFLINLAFSIGFSFVKLLHKLSIDQEVSTIPYFNVFLTTAIVFFLTGGFLFSLGYFEFYKKKQYIFYFNLSITKIGLFSSAFIINSLIGIALIILNSYA
jgi:hypothetical protein